MYYMYNYYIFICVYLTGYPRYPGTNPCSTITVKMTKLPFLGQSHDWCPDAMTSKLC